MADLSLPIFDITDTLLESCGESARIILQAPTGSGKSTQVPQILLDHGLAGDGMIIVLQPRRLATRMLATRVAEERGVALGDEVGYQIRLESFASHKTRILFVTEGILLRKMLHDPELSGISALIFDEFHERHLHGDISLARAIELQETTRPDLKLIVMSATLDEGLLQTALAPCKLIQSSGRMFPVDVEYLRREPGETPVWDLAADTMAAEFDTCPGNALIFMPGAYEIQRTIRAIQDRLGSSVPVLPLHGELPHDQQDMAAGNNNQRRIIVSTNVAETSLTIQNVTLVIDSGLARTARFDPDRGLNTLYIEKISHASAQQRSGRAGRTSAGKCVRLWTERDHARRPVASTPEIRRMDLSETLLHLKACGVDDAATFRWIEAPDPVALARAESLLKDIGAIDSGKITTIGRRMLSFPVHPRYARMFIAAGDLGCVKAAALIAAITQSRNLLLRADKKVEATRAELFGDAGSDFQIAMRAWSYADRQGYRVDSCRKLGIHADAARQTGKLFAQFLDIARKEGLPVTTSPSNDDAIAKCVLVAFADHVARRRSPGTLQCDIVHNRTGMLSRSSSAQESTLIVAAEIHDIEGRDREAQVQLSMVTGIHEEWLSELFPSDFAVRNEVCFDRSQNRVVMRSERLFRDLVLDCRDRDAGPSAETSACLAREVVSGNLILKQWNDAVEQWITRVNRLAGWMPELSLPPIGESDREWIIAEVCKDATCYRDIKEKPVLDAVRSWLSATQQKLVDQFTPERIALPGGRKAKVIYSPEADPFIAAKIQDLFGLSKAPTLCAGRVPLTVHILAPNMRPVQVTRDLASFWSDAYPKLSQELKRRYPKHEWR